MQRTIPKEQLARASRTIRLGESYDLDELTGMLAAAGYVRSEQVEGVGQFALRGGILDVFFPLGTGRCGWNSSGTRPIPWAFST